MTPEWAARPPEPLSGSRPELPETRSYQLKRLLLGQPLTNDQLHSEQLGKPTALAVLSSDVMSSCAYATESVLRILIPAAGLAAFALVTPITLMLLAVLGFVCLCYRQVVRAYPVTGGSYVVSRENFGYSVAQIPAAALLCSYILTVAVSVAAGVDAVISAFPALRHDAVELSVGCVLLLTLGNLRGIREAGRFFALPTYWFLASVAALFVAGLVRLALTGHLHRFSTHLHGQLALGHEGSGLLLGASAFLFLRAFANGGSAMTGMEAISNAVTIFKTPQVRHARQTLVLMATILGMMFLGVSVFAALTHAIPFTHGTPTVLSQLGGVLFGRSTWLGTVGYYSLQFSTALILILGANTSFNGFPLLVSFIARDAYLPRRLTLRGHRLVYSNGIFMLAAASIVLLLVTGAVVASLIPLYACTVFTGFTMAGAGMTKYHLSRRDEHRARNLTVSIAALVASSVVTGIFVVTEFTRGAWLVVIAIPLLVLGLTRTHRRYVAERRVLSEDLSSPPPAEAALRNHVVIVFVDRLDIATSRALQLARSLSSSEDVRAVHFDVDPERTERLKRFWSQPGLANAPLDIVDCPDRRIVRAATELAAELAADGNTEVTIVLPRRAHKGLVSLVLHDRTADRIVASVNQLPHVSATIATFDVGRMLRERERDVRLADDDEPAGQKRRARRIVGALTSNAIPLVDGVTPIGELAYRRRAVVAARVKTVRVQPSSGVPSLECTIVDSTGALLVVFLGRRSVAGVEPGALLRVQGMVGRHGGHLAMINPNYEFLAAPVEGSAPAS